MAWFSPGLGVVAMVALASATQAEIIGIDTFSYEDGWPLVGAEGSAWNNIGGSEGGLVVSGGQALLTPDGSEDAALDLAGGPYSSGNIYFSFCLTMTALPSSGGTYFAMLGTAFSFRDRLFAYNGSGSTYSLGINNENSSQTAAEWSSLNLNETYTVVGRADLDTDTSYLWVNPVNESSTVVSRQFASTYDVTFFALRQDSAGSTMLIDNLLVGTSFADVVGTPIPEPTTMGLLGLGALVLTRRRKPRR